MHLVARPRQKASHTASPWLYVDLSGRNLYNHHETTQRTAIKILLGTRKLTMSNESNTPLSQSTENSNSANLSTNDGLEDLIRNQVNKTIDKRNKRFVTVIIGIFTIIPAVIIAGGGFVLRNYESSAVEKKVNPILADVERAKKDVQFSFAVMELNIRLNRIDNILTERDAEHILKEIRSLITNAEEFDLSHDILRFAIETARKNFERIDRFDLVNELNEITNL